MDAPVQTASGRPDWETLYRQGTPPWDSDRPHAELLRVLDEYKFRSGTVLELGCGSGADAVLLARRRFEVTAIDCSAIAIERARSRAEQHDAVLRFVLGDAFEFARTSGPFDLVYDAGFYHCVRQTDREALIDMLWRVTRPGSHYLTLIGAEGETTPGGPPQVSEKDIRGELGRLFEFVHLRPALLESPRYAPGYRAWSCLTRRPKLT